MQTQWVANDQVAASPSNSHRIISLKAAGSRGIYCVNECIPQELLQLFDAMSADGVLVPRSPLPIEQSKLGVLH
jgi:hypothetical protein